MNEQQTAIELTPAEPGQRLHTFWFGANGNIRVRNRSAYWIPEFSLTKQIGGTIYTVSGSYEGSRTFVRRLERLTTEKFSELLEVSQ